MLVMHVIILNVDPDVSYPQVALWFYVNNVNELTWTLSNSLWPDVDIYYIMFWHIIELGICYIKYNLGVSSGIIKGDSFVLI